MITFLWSILGVALAWLLFVGVCMAVLIPIIGMLWAMGAGAKAIGLGE